MPNYQDPKSFSKMNHEAFDKLHVPGTLAPGSGIYSCDTCGFEMPSVAGKPLPSARNCVDHDPRWKIQPGKVRWRLIAVAIQATG